ncbi:hypothetical protein IMSAG049_01319 [Clostridiales bacterium]|nr:hypothetical protein IMSAG049_01319 [Clostridiales bacterium]
MKGDAVPVTGIIAENVAEGTAFEVRVKADKEQAEWIVAKTGEIDKIGEPIYFNKPGVDLSDPRIWAYDVAVMEIEIAGGANISLLDYPGDRIDFNDKASVGILSSDYDYGEDIISKGTIVVVGKYRGNPVFNNIKVEARYNTAVEAAEKDTSIERVMNGYALLLCELPEDNAVSDTSDGMFIFVPNWEEEKALNTNDGVTDDFPMEIKAAIYRSDDPNSSDDEYVTGETLWISFPDDESMPYIDLR